MRLWVLFLPLLLVEVCIAQEAPPGPDIADTYHSGQRELVRAAAVKRTNGDLKGAARLLMNAHQMEKSHLDTLLLLAEVTLELSDYESAEGFFALALKLQPNHPRTMLGLIDAIAHSGAAVPAFERALQIARVLEDKPESKREALIRIASIHTHQGREADASNTWNRVLRIGMMSDQDKLKLGDYYRTFNHMGSALRWYRDCGLDTCAERLKDMQRGAPLAADLSVALTTRQPPPELAIARSMISRGQHAHALALLKQLAERQPDRHELQALLGDTHVQTGHRSSAELAYLRAIALGGHTAENYLRLADFYVTESSLSEGRRRLATHYLGQAYRLNPKHAEISLRYAEGLQGLKEYAQAYRVLTRPEQQSVPSHLGQRFRALRHSLERTRTVGPDGQPLSRGLDPQLATALRLRSRGELQGALDVLLRMPGSARTARHFRELAVLSKEMKNSKDAITYYRKASELDPKDSEHDYQLGLLYLEEGLKDKALSVLRGAREKGSRDAELTLCEHWVVGQGEIGIATDIIHMSRLYACQQRLHAIETDPGYLARRAEVRTLRQDVTRRLLVLYSLGGFLLFIALLITALLLRSRFGGYTLGEFIALKPSAAPAVQRVLSAIRHEILKHNTTALTGLVDAIEDGERIVESARWCEQSLFGTEASADQSAYLRLDDYIDQLDRIARSHDVRLNLIMADPTFKSLVNGMDRLETLLPQLSGLKPGVRPSTGLTRRLKQACELVNGAGFRGIVSLLDTLRVTQVDAALLHDIFDGIRQEPAFRTRQVMPLELGVDTAALPFQVSITLHELEDILRNPMRNAIQASLEAILEPAPIVVGLDVHTSLEPITGLMTVELSIKDQSPVPLDPEILQSQHVEHGLGLALRLLIEHDGTISVSETEPPWCKAVVIVLPIVEIEGDWAL